MRHDDAGDTSTTLVPGTVATSVGTVTRGNGSGHDSIEVAIGAMPANAAVTIAFQVLIEQQADLAVANQATVEFTSSGSGGNLQTPVPSDDPDTAEEDDPTITPIVKRPTNLEPGDEPGSMVAVIYLPVVSSQ